MSWEEKYKLGLDCLSTSCLHIENARLSNELYHPKWDRCSFSRNKFIPIIKRKIELIDEEIIRRDMCIH